ncbi:MAG: glycosyltransferase family 4 protein [Lachnospiraceae bacterium]|nr:glycosyltransferase family 4 protein [Lachnospiraceae bacterium]
MKVLHINCNYMTSALHQVMMEHLDLLTENEVFCPILIGRDTCVTPNRNVTVAECFRSVDRLFFFGKQKKILRAAERAYDFSSFDLIHAYTLMTDGNLAQHLSEEYGIPYVVAVRDTDVNEFFRLKPYLIPRGIRIMENASKIFFLSETYKEKVFSYVSKEKAALLNDKAEIIPNGIDDFWLRNKNEAKKLTEEPDQNETIRILCVGQLVRYKNMSAVADAVEKLRLQGKDVRLNVIGKIRDEKVYQELLSHPFVSYCPPMDKEELIRYYRNSDLFVLVSHAETFGLVYAEAMSQGLPVIYTRGQGFDGQFPEGVVGYSCADDDIDELTERIGEVIDNYSTLSMNALREVDKFNWRDLCGRYAAIYHEIAEA